MKILKGDYYYYIYVIMLCVAMSWQWWIHYMLSFKLLTQGDQQNSRALEYRRRTVCIMKGRGILYFCRSEIVKETGDFVGCIWTLPIPGISGEGNRHLGDRRTFISLSCIWCSHETMWNITFLQEREKACWKGEKKRKSKEKRFFIQLWFWTVGHGVWFVKLAPFRLVHLGMEILFLKFMQINFVKF